MKQQIDSWKAESAHPNLNSLTGATELAVKRDDMEEFEADVALVEQIIDSKFSASGAVNDTDRNVSLNQTSSPLDVSSATSNAEVFSDAVILEKEAEAACDDQKPSDPSDPSDHVNDPVATDAAIADSVSTSVSNVAIDSKSVFGVNVSRQRHETQGEKRRYDCAAPTMPE